VLEFDNGIETSERLYFWCARERCEERADDFVTVTRRFFEQGFTEGGVKYFYTRDHLGSIREVTDQSGGVRARYDYDPYGRQTKLAGDKDATFAYTGQQTHAPSGLYYYRARYYDPRIGRFLSEDPIGLEGGQNLYGYALNDPIDLSDPLGLLPKSTLGGDDPGFDDPKDMIRQLEEQLKDPDLTQRQREAIRRRIRELQRRPSGKQQHHRSFCGNANPTACGVAMILVAYVCVRRTLLNTVTNTPPPQPPPLPPFVPIVPWWLVLLP
jgi:RHS repeat-associated protein